MKKFLLQILTFGLLVLAVVVIGIIMPTTPRASKSLLFAKVQKDSLLKNTEKPRIILIGGSNLSFGINSRLIKDSLALNPINTAIHASIGLQYMLNSTVSHIQNGDIVIVAPEYSHFYGNSVYGGEELLRIVADVDLNDLKYLGENQLKSIGKYILKYSFSKFKPTEYLNVEQSDIYGVNSFNDYGDVSGHWPLDSQKFSTFTITDNYNPETINLLKEFGHEVQTKGARLFITFPGLQESSFNKNILQIRRVENELNASQFNLLGTALRYKIPDTLMFNTPYHLSKNGVDYRTQLLIRDIKKVLKNY
jgi:hypothetical protein